VETLGQLLTPTFAEMDSKDVNRGIQEVKKFLDVYTDLDGNKKSHLYVDASCTNTIFEFQNYRTKTLARSEENPQEAPKKWGDHAMDAIRYGIMHLYVLGAGRYHLADVQEDEGVPVRVRAERDLPFNEEGWVTLDPSPVFTLGKMKF